MDLGRGEAARTYCIFRTHFSTCIFARAQFGVQHSVSASVYLTHPSEPLKALFIAVKSLTFLFHLLLLVASTSPIPLYLGRDP